MKAERILLRRSAMKKAAKIFIPLILVLMVMLSACGSSPEKEPNEDPTPEEEILGTWKMILESASYWEFKEDGVLVLDLAGDIKDASYEIDGDRITIKCEGEEITLDFTIDGDEMHFGEKDYSDESSFEYYYEFERVD